MNAGAHGTEEDIGSPGAKVTGVLGTELRSPGKAESALNYRAISPTTESDSLPDYNMNGF